MVQRLMTFGVEEIKTVGLECKKCGAILWLKIGGQSPPHRCPVCNGNKWFTDEGELGEAIGNRVKRLVEDLNYLCTTDSALVHLRFIVEDDASEPRAKK